MAETAYGKHHSDNLSMISDSQNCQIDTWLESISFQSLILGGFARQFTQLLNRSVGARCVALIPDEEYKS